MNDKNDYIKAAHQIIIALGLPRAHTAGPSGIQ